MTKIHDHPAPNLDDARSLYAVIVNGEMADQVAGADPTARARLADRVEDVGVQLGGVVERIVGASGDPTPAVAFGRDLRSGVTTAMSLASTALPVGLGTLDEPAGLAILAWLGARGLGGGPHLPDRGQRCHLRFAELGLRGEAERAFDAIGRDGQVAAAVVAAILRLPMWRPDGRSHPQAILADWRADPDLRLGLARFDEIVAWTAWVALIRLVEYPPAYGHADPPVGAWVGSMAQRLREIGPAAPAEGA